MKINFHTDALRPMLNWLMTYKTAGTRDETELRRILSLPDYQVEFARYSMEGLPVCGIGFEEAVDFFLHFDTKDFENPRLQSKKASFLAFFRALEERTASIREFSTVAESDMALMEELLRNGLPDAMLAEIGELGIILIVSIGNSMGWPYENYIDYDVASLNQFAGAMIFSMSQPMRSTIFFWAAFWEPLGFAARTSSFRILHMRDWPCISTITKAH